MSKSIINPPPVVRVGGVYKTRGDAPVDLFGYIPNQKEVTIVLNSENWCDHLPFVAMYKGYKFFTCDQSGRVYPPGYRGKDDYEGWESPWDLIEEVSNER